MKRAIIYSRTNKTRYQGHGPAGSDNALQIEWSHSKAGELGAEVVATFIEISDHDSADRPVMIEALEYCRQNRVDYFIIYWALDIRFPGCDLGAFVEELGRAGAELVCCQRS